VISILYENRGTTAILVKHTKLNCLRIVKCISKEAVCYLQGEAEAKLLLHLRHPGIPTLYDYKEDDQRVYIVEEYMEGQSLMEYLLHHKISQEQCRDYAIQLCDILEYLHSDGPIPILYLDMKPEHIMIQGDVVRLVDFGIAVRGDAPGGGCYGTLEYAPPELKRGSPTEASDLYSLAKTLEYAVRKSGIQNPRIQAILHMVLQENPKERLSLREWRQKWMELEERKLVHGGISKTVAIVGNDHGVGCTHIAISLTVYLRKQGETAYYENPKVQEDVLENIKRNASVYREKDGIIYHNGFYGFRTTGPGVISEKPPEGIRIWDCGTDLEMAKEADCLIYVFSGSLWKDQRVPKVQGDWGILCNFGCRGTGQRYARAVWKKVYGFPLDEDPFAITTEKNKIFSKIRKEVGI